MKKLATLAMALVLFFTGQAMALMIDFDFDLGSTLYIEGSDPLAVNLNLFNDSTEAAEFSFYGGSFSSNGDYLQSQIGDIYTDYSLAAGETQTVLYRQFWANVLDWTTFNYVPAEEGAQMNVTSLSINGVLNGAFSSWGIAALEPGANIFSVRVGTDPNGAAPVPEPATMWLVGTGLAGLVGFSRRQRRKAVKG